MLTNLHVKNMALIDEIDIDFENGLTVLSGETGAGKSVILGSVAVALGLKNPKDMVREEDKEAIAQVCFYFNRNQIDEKLRGIGIEPSDDGNLIIQRKINAGRSQFKINGINTSSAQIKEFAPFLLDLHAQRDNLRLLKEENQIELLDSFCDEKLFVEKEKLKGKYTSYLREKSILKELNTDSETKEREKELLRYEINEIEAAAIKEGEDTVLEEQFKIALNSKKIMGALDETLSNLSYAEANAADSIGAARKTLGIAATYDDKLKDTEKELADAEGIISDCIREIGNYIETIGLNEEEFEELNERLNVYNHLKSKYAPTTEKILELLEEKKDRFELLENADEEILKLQKNISVLESEITDICNRISDIRSLKAKELSSNIEKAAKDMNFEDMRFEISLKKAKSFTENGADIVEFIFSSNPGEEMKPLKDTASGGELSRIMLAIKTVTSKKDETDTLIFDEIDTGISGRTAQKVAEKMAELSDERQIICITHLPQIAAMADYHFLISKEIISGRTFTNISLLDKTHVADELSRLLGGSKITENVKNNALEMLEMANEYKKVNRK